MSETTKVEPTDPPTHVRNVVVVGAAGQLGAHITRELLKTGRHNVSAITRVGGKKSFPDGVTTLEVDYEDLSSLISAMKGHDALVITMNALAPADSVAKLVDAAIQAGVPWILPNEWGGDYTDAAINQDTRLGADKLRVRDQIESQGSGSAWIAVACGFWYDYSLQGDVALGFDFGDKRATFYDDGELKMYYSTLPYCGQAVAKLLSLPVSPANETDETPCLENYRNKIVRVQAFHLNQKDMLASVLRVTGDQETQWTVKRESSEVRYNQGKQMLAEGNVMGWRLMLYSRMFYPTNPTRKLEDYSDAQLGLVPPNLDDVTRDVVMQAAQAGAST